MKSAEKQIQIIAVASRTDRQFFLLNFFLLCPLKIVTRSTVRQDRAIALSCPQWIQTENPFELRS
jgi:hypothetical protein